MVEEMVRRIPEWDVVRFDRWPSAEVRGPAHLELALRG